MIITHARPGDLADIVALEQDGFDATEQWSEAAWAQELAAGPPKAMAAAKRLLWSGVGTGVDACLSEEARTVSELSGTADAREGLAAVIERRKPVFTGK